MEKKLLQFIEQSENILITTHISPDPDAVASALLLYTTLKLNFKGKKISVVLEEVPDKLDFLTGYSDINFSNIHKFMVNSRPDLFMIVDAPNLQRVTREPVSEMKNDLAKLNTTTVAIDHHPIDKSDNLDLYINDGGPAATQEVYELLFEKLKLSKPKGYAETTLLGIYSDTGGFIYKNTKSDKTFKLVSELVSQGVSLESIRTRLHSFDADHIEVFSELTTNLHGRGDHTVSYISDDFFKRWQTINKPAKALHTACKMFVDAYIRNVEGRQWGYIVYRDPLLGENGYSVSLRSVANVKDVSEVARKLDGGGHKPAAGGRVSANSVKEAIALVEKAATG